MNLLSMLYWSTVLGFGIGMAIDLFFATISKFRDDKLGIYNWALPLGITHSVFPALMFSLVWYVGEVKPEWQSYLGGVGAVLIALVIFEILMEETGRDFKFGLTTLLGGIFKTEKKKAQRILLILAVSWDSLLGTPSLYSIFKDWSVVEIILAFIMFGVTAMLAGIFALGINRVFRVKKYHNWKSLAKNKIVGSYLSLSTIGSFGLVSGMTMTSLDYKFYQMLPYSALILLAVFFLIRRDLWSESVKEARIATGD